MNARGRQKPTPPTRLAGRGRTGGPTCLCPAHSFATLGPIPGSRQPLGRHRRRPHRRRPARRRPRPAGRGLPPASRRAPPTTTSTSPSIPPPESSLDSEVITWRNPGQVAAYSIRLHLYWNAFRNTNSTWLKQRHLAGDDPFAFRSADDFGYTNVTRLTRLNDDGSETDLLKDFRFISPDDQNADDRIAGGRDAGRRRAARRDDATARGMDGQVSAQLRSHRRDRQLLLRLAMVPEARRLRSRRLERAPVLCELRVLCGLRQLRRAHHGAGGLDRRRDRRRAVAHRCRRQDHASLRAGGRA